jgi:hypothetical protein
MKKALVLAIVCALGLGFAGFAASPLSGSWSTDICFEPLIAGQSLDVHSFLSILDLDYTVGGWIFGMTLILDDVGFDNLYFDTVGNLGAFSIASFLDFNPLAADPRFLKWENAAQVSIAGVQFYGLMSVHNFGAIASPMVANDMGTGWAFGGIGTSGDLKIGAGIDFNLTTAWGVSPLYMMWNYGWDVLTTWVDYSCGVWSKGMLNPIQTPSCVCWTNFDLYAKFPFTCTTVILELNFDPVNGFDHAIIKFDDINVGIPWLLLDDVDIAFHVASKAITLDWQLVYTGVCFTPYFSIVYDAGTGIIGGIKFNALTLSYTWNGVTFKAGELFGDHVWGGNHYGFSATGDLTYSCILNTLYDEFFGVEVNGDSCCGGAFSAGVYNFFQVGAATGIFDWQETLVNLEFGIASNLTIRVSLGVDTVDINSLCIGFTFTW